MTRCKFSLKIQLLKDLIEAKERVMNNLLPKRFLTSFVRLNLLSLFFLGAISSQAKDLTNRLGVGYSDNFHVTLPSLAVRYYPNPQLGVSASLGVDTKENDSKFGFMARIYRIIFMEDNLNFYMGAGAGLISQETQASNNSGFELAGFAGAEFFFTGLDSLGFTFEMGVAVSSVASETRFRTFGDHPIKGGIIFYF